MQTRLPVPLAFASAVWTTGPQCPNGCALIFGGQTCIAEPEPCGLVDTIYRFDPSLDGQLGSLVQLSTRLPYPTSETQTFWLDRDLSPTACPQGCAYLLGGRTSNSAISSVIRYAPASIAEISEVSQLPERTFAGSVVFDGSFAYYIGGCCEAGVLRPNIFRFDPFTNQMTALWGRLPSGPTDALAWSSAVWDRETASAYFLGGRSSSGHWVNRVVKWNFSGGVPTGPQPLSSHMALQYHERINPQGPVPGCCTEYGGQDDVGVFWDRRGITETVTPGQQSGQCVEGCAYLVGGKISFEFAHATIQRFDPHTGEFKLMNSRLNKGTVGMGIAWDETHRKAYFFGGWQPPAKQGVPDMSDEILVFDPITDTLETLPVKLPTLRVGVSAVWSDPYIYLFGGFDMEWDTNNQVWQYENLSEVLRFDPRTNNLTPMRSRLPYGRLGSPAFRDPSTGTIFMMGGWQCCGNTGWPVRDIFAYLPDLDLPDLLATDASSPPVAVPSVNVGSLAMRNLSVSPLGASTPVVMPPGLWRSEVLWDGLYAHVFGKTGAHINFLEMPAEDKNSDSFMRFDPRVAMACWLVGNPCTGSIVYPEQPRLPRALARNGAGTACDKGNAYIFGGKYAWAWNAPQQFFDGVTRLRLPDPITGGTPVAELLTAVPEAVATTLNSIQEVTLQLRLLHCNSLLDQLQDLRYQVIDQTRQTVLASSSPADDRVVTDLPCSASTTIAVEAYRSSDGANFRSNPVTISGLDLKTYPGTQSDSVSTNWSFEPSCLPAFLSAESITYKIYEVRQSGRLLLQEVIGSLKEPGGSVTLGGEPCASRNLQVDAVNGAGAVIGVSNVAEARTLDKPTYLAVNPYETSYPGLSWGAPAACSVPPTSYHLLRGTAPGAETFLVDVGTARGYWDTDVVPGLTYYYKVVATFPGGVSARVGLPNDRGVTPTGVNTYSG